MSQIEHTASSSATPSLRELEINREKKKGEIQNKCRTVLSGAGSKFRKWASEFSVIEAKRIDPGSRSNDVYLRLKMRAPAGSVVEIRARVDQMLAQLDDYNNGQQLYLGGYVKADINSRPSSHALEQDWYKADATVIAEAIKSANPLLFP